MGNGSQADTGGFMSEVQHPLDSVLIDQRFWTRFWGGDVELGQTTHGDRSRPMNV